MLGYIRFFLALLVLLSHVKVTFYGINPGVTAVIIFYLLSGYVVSHLYQDILVNHKNKLFFFYKDRVMRIFPLYFYILILTILFLSVTKFGNPNFSFTNMCANIIIIPLNYYMIIPFNILTTPTPSILVPPVWSLGAELQVYLILPILFLFSRIKIILAFLTFSVYLAANFSIFQSDYFGYRLIVGVLFIFLIGSSIHKLNSEKLSIKSFDKYFPLIVWIIIIFLIPIFYFTGIGNHPFTRETFLGLIIGIPLLFFATKYKKNLLFNKLLGSLSYGIFLSHFLSIWILNYFGYPDSNYKYNLLVIVISIIISYIGILLIEKRIDTIRINKN